MKSLETKLEELGSDIQFKNKLRTAKVQEFNDRNVITEMNLKLNGLEGSTQLNGGYFEVHDDNSIVPTDVWIKNNGEGDLLTEIINLQDKEIKELEGQIKELENKIKEEFIIYGNEFSIKNTSFLHDIPREKIDNKKGVMEVNGMFYDKQTKSRYLQINFKVNIEEIITKGKIFLMTRGEYYLQIDTPNRPLYNFSLRIENNNYIPVPNCAYIIMTYFE